METLIAPTINLAILLSILVYYTRAPLRGFVQQRHESLRDELARVREQLKQARVKFDEFSAKLKAIDVEIGAIQQQTRVDAEAMKSRIIAEGQKLSAHVVEDARNGAQNLYSELRAQLYGEFTGRVLDRAEALLKERLTGDDRARIQREFSTLVENVS